MEQPREPDCYEPGQCIVESCHELNLMVIECENINDVPNACDAQMLAFRSCTAPCFDLVADDLVSALEIGEHCGVADNPGVATPEQIMNSQEICEEALADCPAPAE